MYRFVFGMDSYSFFNNLAGVVLIILVFIYTPLRRDALGLNSRWIIFHVSNRNVKAGNIIKILLMFIESFLTAVLLLISAVSINKSFGEMMGTGSNYFGTLFTIPVLWLILSLILRANPLKQLDFGVLFAPIFLFIIRIACFTNGCCWGIPWEYGPYNHHYDHPGRQVPVQLIEMIFVLAIFIFLLLYRKKAKPGTLYPLYMILYSVTRFFNEILSAAEPDIIGPFNMYHVLCVIAIICGSIMLVMVYLFGERISSFFVAQQNNIIVKQAQKDEAKAKELAKAEAK